MATATFEDWVGITDVLNRYAEALDSRDWALMDQVFTPDAVGNYGRENWRGRETIVANIRRHLGGCGPTQHLLSNYKIEVDGDGAKATVRLRAYHTGFGERASLKPFEIWAFYFDDLVCTKEGWRIIVRQERTAIATGDIGVLQPD